MKIKQLTTRLLLASIIFLAGCSNGKNNINDGVDNNNIYAEETIHISETNEDLILQMNITDEIVNIADETLTLTKDNEEVENITVIDKDDYDFYNSYIKSDTDKVVSIKEGRAENYDYIFWNYNNEAYNCVLLLDDSDVALYISNKVSESNAKMYLANIEFLLA